MNRNDFDKENFKKEKIAVHCKTEKEADDFFNFMGWGRYPNYHYRYGINTCYDTNNDGSYYYGGKDWYMEHEYKILEWSDYMEIEPKEIEIDLSSASSEDLITELQRRLNK